MIVNGFRIEPGADLRGVNFQGADLRGVNFQGADLQGANFQDADLRYADFRYADLRKTNLKGADLTGAGFQDANLRGAVVGVPVVSVMRTRCSRWGRSAREAACSWLHVISDSTRKDKTNA